jgi:T5SS/PEP-CTERM-associated repeat protein/autotransporter-associated beta strand protein
MQTTSRLRRRRQLAAGLTAALAALGPFSAFAQTSGFTGVFAPENWTFTSGGSPADFAWDATFTSFTFNGSNDGSGQASDTLFTVNLADAYRVSFDWIYSTADNPAYDYAGYTGGTFTQLSVNSAGMVQSGSTSSPVYFGVGPSGFYVSSFDNTFGAASITISNFSFTLAAPDDTGGDDNPDGGGGGPPDPGSPYTGTTSWSGSTGNWNTSANWSEELPTAAQQAVIVNSSAVTVTTAVEAHSVYIDNSDLTISGSGSLTQANTQSAFVADYGATFTVTGPAASWSNAGYLVLYTASAVFDQGSTSSVGGITLAYFGDNIANLTVRNGATFAAGDVNVGYNGRAEFRVESGATVTLGDVLVGYDDGAEGLLSVTGAGTRLTTGFLKLGEFAQGSLTISDGAVVTSSGAAIAYGSVSGAGDVVGSATVTGSGSRWEIGSDLGVSGYIDASTFNSGTLTLADSGLVRIGATGAGTLQIHRGGTVHIGVGGAAGVLQAGTVDFVATSGSAALLAFNHSDDITFSPLITGRGRLSKAGAGTLTLTADNDYTQNTTVTGGTLQLGDGGTTGSLTGSVAVSSGATLAFKRSNNLTFAGVVSGAGRVVQNGSGILTLSGTNTHTGGTRVNAGTLSVSSNAHLGNTSGGVTLAGGNLRLSNNTATTFNRAVTVSADSGVISNRSSNGAGVTHVLGTLSIGAHTLAVSRGPSATSGTGGITFGATTLTGDATFNVGANARLNLGAIGGDYGFTKTGAGNLTLTGVNTFTGPLTIGAGTLALASTASLSPSTDIRVGTGATFDTSAVAGGYTVSSGNTLGGTGSFSGLVTLGSGAGISPGNSPGTLTFTGGLALNSGSFLDFELGTLSDLIRVTGGTLFGPEPGTVTVNLFDSGSFSAGIYTLIDATGAALSGIDATSFQLGATIGGYDYSFQQSGNLFQLVATTAVPEPASAAALAGLFTLALAATRRTRHG